MNTDKIREALECALEALIAYAEDNAKRKGREYCEDYCDEIKMIRAALAELDRNRRAAPAGWVLVPISPTEKMLLKADKEAGCRKLQSIALITWQAMLSAAPSPPAPVAVDERKEFEKWATSGERQGPGMYRTGPNDPNEYQDNLVAAWWQAWQARAALGGTK
jgi:hypothetical protein